MTNVPSGTNYYGPNGEILKYSISQNAGWLAQWNTSSVVLKNNAGMAVAWAAKSGAKLLTHKRKAKTRT